MAALLAIGLTGCETLHLQPAHPSTRFRDAPGHLSEEARLDLKVIAVAPSQEPTTVIAGGPDYGKQGDEVRKGAMEGVRATFEEAGNSDGMAIIALPIVLPIMAGVGAVAGAVEAEMRENRKETTDELLQAHPDPLPNHILAREIDGIIAETEGYASSAEPAAPPRAADALLTVGVEEISAWIVGSQARFAVRVNATLTRLPGKEELLHRSYVYQDIKPLGRWADDDGRRWKVHLASARDLVSRSIVNDVLTLVELRHVLRPVPTDDYARFDQGKLTSRQPNLAWEFVLLGGDDHQPAPISVHRDTMRYDLEIYRDGRLVYQRGGLEDSAHRVEDALEGCTRYRWSVRPVYRINEGQRRVGEWMERRPTFSSMVSDSGEAATFSASNGSSMGSIPTIPAAMDKVVGSVDRFLAIKTPCKPGGKRR